ncbi:MAG: hypothetical protein IJV40_07985 [Oscillospiraceae bacterium]|nr:hypothetical protein [Oscillospiraceae bacterium]
MQKLQKTVAETEKGILSKMANVEGVFWYKRTKAIPRGEKKASAGGIKKRKKKDCQSFRT